MGTLVNSTVHLFPIRTDDRRSPRVMEMKFVTVMGQISPKRPMVIRSLFVSTEENLSSRMEMLNQASCVTKNLVCCASMSWSYWKLWAWMRTVCWQNKKRSTAEMTIIFLSYNEQEATKYIPNNRLMLMPDRSHWLTWFDRKASVKLSTSEQFILSIRCADVAVIQMLPSFSSSRDHFNQNEMPTCPTLVATLIRFSLCLFLKTHPISPWQNISAWRRTRLFLSNGDIVSMNSPLSLFIS